MCNLFVYEGEDFWCVSYYQDHARSHGREYMLWKDVGAPRSIHGSYKRFYEPPVSSVPLPKKFDALLRAYVQLKGDSK